MTLTMAWIRKIGKREESVFASDSRLSGGAYWDCCQKILILPRGDCLIAFAGSTLDAYPLMIQFRNWIELDASARSRAYDINNIKKRMRLMFNDMRLFISVLPVGQTKPDPADCELIFGGWSWRSTSFKLWRFYYRKELEAFDFQPVGVGYKVGKLHPIIFAGTPDAVELARDRIVALLKSRERFQTPYLDMEPFEVLRDIIREGKFNAVGGPPQLAKVYPHGDTQVFAVRWEMPKERAIPVLGRPLFPNERTRLRLVIKDSINFLPEKTVKKSIRKFISRAETKRERSKQ